MRYPLGRQAVLLFSTNGTSFTHTQNVKDVTLNLTKQEDDDTVRANGGWKSTIGTLKEGSLDFQVMSDGTDVFFLALQGSFFNDADLKIEAEAVKAGLTTGSKLSAWVTCVSLTRNENIGEAVKYQVSLKIANPPAGLEAQVPTWTTATTP